MPDRRTNNKIFTGDKILQFVAETRGHTTPVGALEPFFMDYVKLHAIAKKLVVAFKSEEHHKIQEHLKELEEII